jgi:O-antigen/teichoic acid export membrane protein
MNQNSLGNRIRTDTIKTIIGSSIPIVFALACIPYLLNSLGIENYGFLVLAWAAIGSLGLFDLGIGRSSTYFVSNAIIKSDSEVRRVVHSGLFFALGMSLLGLLVVLAIFFLWAWFDNTILIYKYFVYIVSAAIIPTVLTVYLRGVVEGLHRFTTSSLNKAAIGSLMFLSPSLMVYMGFSKIEHLLIALLLARVIVLFHLLWHLKNFFTKITPSIKQMKEMFSYGSWVSVTGVIGPIMTYGDRFFITYFFGVASLPVYATSQEILQRMLIIPASLSSAILPKISLIKSDKYMESYNKVLLTSLMVMMPICLLAAFIFPVFLEFWISADFSEEASSISRVIILGIFFSSLSYVTFTFLYAIKKTKDVAIVHIFELIFYALLLVILANIMGFIGVAIAWSVRAIFGFLALHIVAIRRINSCCQ